MISVLTPSIRPQGLEVVRHALRYQTYKDFEWIHELKADPGSTCDLSACMNRLLRRASGAYIVFLQDYIDIGPYALEHIDRLSRTYTDIGLTFPVGKRRDNGIKWDWRHARGDVEAIEPAEWEIDFGAIHRQPLLDIGGFDERFDEGFSSENIDVAYRLAQADVRFRVVPSIEGIAYDHDKHERHPYRNEKNYRRNTEYLQRKKMLIDAGEVLLGDL